MSWFDIFKATCVRCKRPYRGMGLEVPKVDGEYLYNFPYKRRRELESRQKRALHGLDDASKFPLVPRVCRECAPKVTQEALAFEGKATHPAEWKHTMKNLNVCDKHKELWLRNHGTQIDRIRESWVKHTNDNTICDYVENAQGKTEKITQVRIPGGKVIKGYIDILKVRTKGAGGKWVVREREAELDSQSGFGGGGGGKPPTRGGGKGPDKDKELILWTTKDCPGCKQLKQWLNSNGFNIREKDPIKEDNKDIKTIPTLQDGNRYIIGQKMIMSYLLKTGVGKGEIPYSQPGGMDLDEAPSTIVPELFRDEEEVAMNPDTEFCCNRIKGFLVEEIIYQIKEKDDDLTTNQEAKIKKTIQEMPCETIHQMMEPENKDNFKIFGIDLTEDWEQFNRIWTVCIAEKNVDEGHTEDLTEDEEFERRRKGKIAHKEISSQEKSQTRFRRAQNLRRTKKGRRQSKRRPHHVRGIERGEGETWGHEESDEL